MEDTSKLSSHSEQGVCLLKVKFTEPRCHSNRQNAVWAVKVNKKLWGQRRILAVPLGQGASSTLKPTSPTHLAPIGSAYTTRQVLIQSLVKMLPRTRGSLPTQKFILILLSVIMHTLSFIEPHLP